MSGTGEEKGPAQRSSALDALAGGGVAERPRLPLFYKAPRPLEAGRDARTTLKETAKVGFAAAANAIPLDIVEFAIAARHYPIVFASTPPYFPVSICGIRPDTNVFVTPAGDWEQGFYVPAYVRRYPFILMENEARNQFVLCADEGSGLLETSGTRRLFDDEGKPTELTTHALEFCRAFQGNHLATRDFVSALSEQGLLVDDTTDIRLPDARHITMQGYKIVDRTRFDDLPDDTFLDWRRRGWLTAIYSHMISLTNWSQLLQRTATQQSGGAADRQKGIEDGG